MKILPWLGLELVTIGSIAIPGVLAQIVPDTTLPNDSQVTLEGHIQRITGGTAAGTNLFHSFDRFNVGTGETAYFDNAFSVDRIITRVTGGQISHIDGLIRTNGTANLFLLNPKGIVFGENAQLDIGGSFFGSTAESVQFEDGSFYCATEPNAPPLLTINVPMGLQFGKNPGSIVNRSISPSVSNPPNPILSLFLPPTVDLSQVGLDVPPGQTLALIGGEIQLIGGNLTALNGKIHLTSIAEEGIVGILPTPLDGSFNDDNIKHFGQISLSDGSFINTSDAGGGMVEITGENITLSGSRIFAVTLGHLEGRGISVNARRLQIGEGSQLSTLTLGEGLGGKISLAATDSVELSGVGTESFNRLTEQFLTSGIVSPSESSIAILTGTLGSGNAGEIAIDTPELLVHNGAGIGNTTFSTGNSGNVTIRAQVFEIVGSGIFSGTLPGSTGIGGSITFEGERSIVRDGAFLASTSITQGAAGAIELHATESVELSRTPEGSVLPTSIITTTTDPRGSAGDVTITTRRLTIADGAGISSSSGGVVGRQLAATTGGLGGNITIQTTESIEIFGFSEVLANETATESFLSARTFSSHPGGDIRLVTPRLTLMNGGRISASSLGAGEAGDITIDAQLLEVYGSSILA